MVRRVWIVQAVPCNLARKTAVLHVAAQQMLVHYGKETALQEAYRRLFELARMGQWPEHALAARLLTAIERIVVQKNS